MAVLKYAVLFLLPAIALAGWVCLSSFLPHEHNQILGAPVVILVAAAGVALNPTIARVRSRVVRVCLWVVGFVAWIPILVVLAYFFGLYFYGAPITFLDRGLLNV